MRYIRLTSAGSNSGIPILARQIKRERPEGDYSSLRAMDGLKVRHSTLQDYKERMLRVLVHIQRHLDDELSLDELARVASFSPFHFHRVFKGMLGESVQEHIRRLRLERAANRLKMTVAPVTDIAFEAGYGTHEAFTRAFKVMTGTSPSEFRKGMSRLRGPAPASRVTYLEHGIVSDFVPGEEEMGMNVEIEKLGKMHVAFVRHVGPYEECGKAWEKLTTALGSRGMIGSDTQHIGLSYDDPEVTPAEKIRYDACVTVGKDFEPEGEIGVQLIDGGEFARTTHLGPYDQLGKTYASLLGEWLPRSGREAASRPCLEIYLNDPEGTDPEDLVTDIYAPLQASPEGD